MLEDSLERYACLVYSSTHISAYKVSVVVNNSPWCDAHCVSLPQVVAPECFYCLAHILRHT